MKKVVLAMFVTLVACSQQNNSSSQVKASDELSGVKYLGVVIFEGGTGNPTTSLPLHNNDTPTENVLWRAHLCLAWKRLSRLNLDSSVLI